MLRDLNVETAFEPGKLGGNGASWLANLDVDAPSSGNVAGGALAFQRWFKFKEAFSPGFVLGAIERCIAPPKTCIDPFGGSGTSALTCQFLGIRPTTIEVNPFLADVIEAKLSSYEVTSLASDYAHIVAGAKSNRINVKKWLKLLPPTFCEPGKKDKWVFDRSVLLRILLYRHFIEQLQSVENRRLFRVLLGSVLVSVSNVTVNGKGRKYRKGWQTRDRDPADVDRRFDEAVMWAMQDIGRYGRRANPEYTLLRGDSRSVLTKSDMVDLAVFSPPYPNSFDYTDVYNLELWVLGYLNDMQANRKLREATLSSHVQIGRNFQQLEHVGDVLGKSMSALIDARQELWDPRIPEMVEAYFHDLAMILKQLHDRLNDKSSVVMAVGNSQYADIVIDVAAILREMAPALGYSCEEVTSIRSMRASAQQGGRMELAESLIHFIKT